MKRIVKLLLPVFALTAGIASAQTLSQSAREQIIKATVMLLPTGQDGKLDGSRGSGTIISPDGYILTNYHVVGDIDSRTLAPWVQVRTIRFVDEAPIPSYWGTVIASDPQLDLAIVKIQQDINERPVQNLNLPFMTIGDSNKMTIGDPIYVFGFQGTGGFTLSYSSGSISGFTGDDLRSSGRQWIKHDAQTGPGNSGGGAYNAQGDLIGVHSASVSGEGNSRTAFMRPLAVAWGLITPNVPKFKVRTGTAITPAPQNPNTGGGNTGGGNTSGGNTGGSTTRLTWPLKPQVGQTWNIQLPQYGNATLKLDGRDSDGDATGTATFSNGSAWKTFFYYDPKEDLLFLKMFNNNNQGLYCAFEQRSISNTKLTGPGFYDRDVKGDTELTKLGDCTAQLGSTAGTTGSGNTGGGTPSASRLSWPVKPQVGQTWSVQLPQYGNATIKLSARDSDGDATGTATFSNGNAWNTFFYYSAQDNLVWLKMVRNGQALFCGFTDKGLDGTKMIGLGFFDRDDRGSAEAVKLGECVVQLK